MPQELPASSAKNITVDPLGYLSEKTIVALATPLGGALGVVRLSGSEAFSIAEKITKKNRDSFLGAHSRKMIRAKLWSQDNKILDDGMFAAFPGPNSYSGEDLVEFFIHGSHAIGELLMETMIKAGARMALPGEFSFRAVKAGKMTLSQAQGVKELVQADSETSLDMALEKLSGIQGETVLEIQNQYMTLLTLSEAGIDFSDQDLDEVSLPQLKKRISPIVSNLDLLMQSFERGKRIADGVPISIVGLPNAGKSSFFNALLGEDRSIVSSIEGTTRDVVKERLSLRSSNGQVVLKVADTAGLRKNADEIEAIGIEKSLSSALGSDVLIVVADVSRTPFLSYWEELSRFLMPALKGPRAVFVLLNKCDSVSEEEARNAKEVVAQHFQKLKSGQGHGSELNGVFLISSKTLFGIHEFSNELANSAWKLIQRNPGEMVLTQRQQVEAVSQAKSKLLAAQNCPDIVLFATEVRHSMNELSILLGHTVADDILSKIFSDFCIGK